MKKIAKAFKNRENILKLHIPLIHTILSLAFDAFFPLKTGLYDPYIKTVEVLGLNYEEERILLLVTGKIAGILLIFTLWNIISYVISKKDRATARCLLLSLVLCIVQYPYSYLIDPDTTVIYYMSVGHHPDYIHGFYTQVFYLACLCVFRHAIMIPLIQSAIFFLILRFFSLRISDAGYGRFRFLPYSILLLPESLNMLLSPSPFALKALFYMIIFILFDSYGKRILEKCSKKKLITMIIAVIFAAAIIRLPQSIGEYTYSGNEIRMEKEFNILSRMLKDPDANLEYKDFGSDMALVSKAVPSFMLLKYDGADALYETNFEKNQKVRQSLLSYDDQRNVIKAAKNFERHNILLLLRTRLSSFITENGGIPSKEMASGDPSTLKHYDDVNTYNSENRDYGMNTVFLSPFTEEWYSSATSYYLTLVTDTVLNAWYSFCDSLQLTYLLHMLFILIPVLLTLYLTGREAPDKVITPVISACAVSLLWLYALCDASGLSGGNTLIAFYSSLAVSGLLGLRCLKVGNYTGRTISLSLKPNLKDVDPVVIYSAFIWLLTFIIVFMEASDLKPNTDYQSHMLLAKFIIHYLKTGLSYFIWHILVFLTFVTGAAFSTLTIEGACALVTATVNMIIYLIIYRLLKKNEVRFPHLLSLLLCVIMPVYLPFFNSRIYLGQGSPVTWHNPTNLMVKPFAIISYFMILSILKKIRDNEDVTKKEYISLSVMILLSVMAKPSFVQGIAPALAIYVSVCLIKNRFRDFKKYFYLLLTFAPMIPLLLIQFITSFYSTDVRSGGIGFGWFAAGKGFSPSPYISLLLVIAFPLLYDILYFKATIKKPDHILTWIYVITSWLQSAILYEKGDRIAEGNFTWAVQIAYTMLFIITVRDFAKDLSSRRDETTGRIRLKFKDFLLSFVLLCHLISGLIYIYRLLFTNMWV